MGEKIILDRKLTPVPCGRRVEPSRHVCDGHAVDLWNTDLHAKFKRIADEQKQRPALNVKPLRKKQG